VWERDIRNFCRVQGLDPNAPGRNQMCRTLIEMNCVGEALARVDLSAHTPPTHPFWTYEGLLHALDAHFSHPEEAEAARRALDSLKMTSKTSARAYCTQFERLLDAVDHMSSSNILYTFTCGLTPRLKEWVNFSKPSSLQDAIALVVRMGGDEQLEQAKQETTATPMDLNKLVASTVTRSLKRLNVGQQQTRPEPSDPRKDKRWPSWASLSNSRLRDLREAGKCFLCEGTSHRWPDCYKLRAQSPSPGRDGFPQRSPSPTWTEREASPGRGNGRGPR
jgi:hypothetical protein